MVDIPTCRICMEDDEFKNFIRPCLCSGTSQYVHRSCLDMWRSQNPNGENFKRCNSCRFEYIIEDNNVDEKKRKKEYNKAVAFDMTLMIFGLVVLVTMISIFIWIIDSKGFCIRKIGWSYFSYVIISIALLCLIYNFFGCHENRIRLYPLPTLDPTLQFGAIIGSAALLSAYSGYKYITGRLTHHKRQIWFREEAAIRRVKDFTACPEKLRLLQQAQVG